MVRTFLVALCFLLAGCAASDEGPAAAPEPGGATTGDAPQPNGTSDFATIYDEPWSHTNPTPALPGDVVIGTWAFESNLTKAWINITVTHTPQSVFATNVAYRGPNDEYDQAAQGSGISGVGGHSFELAGPTAGDWEALFRKADFMPAGNSGGHVTVTVVKGS